jgi:NAD+ diphosphatase
MRRPNVFASSAIDRAHQLRRDEAALRSARQNPEARVALVWRSKSLVSAGDPRPALLAISEIAELIEEVESAAGAAVPLVWLGLHRERPHFALDVSDLEQPTDRTQIQSAGDFVDLRQIGALVEAEDGALLAYARAMMSWHRRHLYCGVCGAPTRAQDAGHLRVCTAEGCESQIFPRTDPAVIMLVHSEPEPGERDDHRLGDHCLLGRQAAWPPGVFSTLAGFVEPGESLENAVAREVFEETGVKTSSADYHSSQPWPFPSSIMLGFYATAVPGEVSVDGDELQEARWFERAELVELVARREVRFPPPMSIARRLIDDWLADESARD